MAFVFEYVGVRYDAEWKDHCLFGRIESGSIRLGESISVTTQSGDQVGVVNSFWDGFYDWLGMPFYHTVSEETIGFPFCIRVFGLTAMPACPGKARAI